MTSPKPNPILRLKWSIQSLQSTWCKQCPSWHVPLILSLLLWYPLWFPSFLAPASIILPLLPFIPTDPTIPSTSTTPKTISLGRGHHGSWEGTCFIRVEDRDDNHYWITCWKDNTGVEFSIGVGRDLVIDPNPHDICYHKLDRVGSLMWLWWGHSFWTRLMVLKDAILVTGKGDARERNV